MNKHIKGLAKGFTLGAVAVAVLGSINGTVAAEATFNGPGDIKPALVNNRYVVTFKNNANVMADGKVSAAAVTSLMQTYGAKTIRTLDRINGVAIEIEHDKVANLLNNEQVEMVEVDQPRYLLDDVNIQAESTPYGITMVQAGQVSDSATGNQKVCIMDTGYNRNHEDLRSAGVTGDDNDGQGNDTGNWYEDGHGHGSHVAGTIAALGGNGVGVVGVNPSGNVGLHIVKVFNNSGNWAYGSDLIAAIGQCEAAGASVISMSLGGGASMTSEANAFASALNNGVLSIAAAGNGGNSSMSYPASYDSVMSVGAVDSSENIASFSQYNSQVEISAPGVNVNSTITGNGYASWSGTSMATPHVSGVAALVWSNYPTCTATQIRDALNNTAKDKGSAGRDNYYGHGIVQAKDAYDSLANGCGTTPPPPPPPGDLDGKLENLSASRGNWVREVIEVPAGISTMTIKISGGSGDADLYVKEGSAPSSGWFGSYDCRPYLNGNEETCTFSNPGQGDWHIGVRAYSTFSGVTLEWTGN
ncbi:S8 family serine peptidase [Thalassomonas viridans]|uniref:S8 family serine peptidase n=1 Tax=Thalassomonas viridans TaxID=137584 RepID=A0AAE9Z1H6_9GAMM|nr:S8 family serine peptidase [Thalassomonas viridans]WDE03497.1 S8 family serine peptidase [Thalassomonas viridans]